MQVLMETARVLQKTATHENEMARARLASRDLDEAAFWLAQDQSDEAPSILRIVDVLLEVGARRLDITGHTVGYVGDGAPILGAYQRRRVSRARTPSRRWTRS